MNISLKRTAACRLTAFFLVVWIFVLTPACALLWGQSRGVAVHRSADLNALKRDIQFFEEKLDLKLSQLPNAMLAVVDRTKGVYLKGYGIVFTFLVNINRVVITTPFGERRVGKQQTQEEKRRRMTDIRDMLIRTMREDPGSFRSLTPTDAVVVVAHFEDSNELDKTKRTKTVVLKILKRDLDAARTEGSKGDGTEDFRKRVTVDEY